jgi:membrane associated rhomboid family serine protease
MSRAEAVAVGWQDRTYSDEDHREHASLWGGVRRPPTTTLTLMVLHGAAFIAVLALQTTRDGAVVKLAQLSGAAAHPVGIVLHPFATASLLAALFTLLALWSLGGRIEAHCGRRVLLTSYIAANIAGGLAFYAVARLAPRLADHPLDYPVGALAALVLIAWREFRYEPTLVFGRATTVGKMYALSAAIVVVLTFLGSGPGTLGWFAAAAAGAGVSPALEHIHWPRFRLRRRRFVRPSIPREPLAPDEPEIDAILEKISRSGLGALSRRERDLLEAARQAKLRHSSHR